MKKGPSRTPTYHGHKGQVQIKHERSQALRVRRVLRVKLWETRGPGNQPKNQNTEPPKSQSPQQLAWVHKTKEGGIAREEVRKRGVDDIGGSYKTRSSSLRLYECVSPPHEVYLCLMGKTAPP